MAHVIVRSDGGVSVVTLGKVRVPVDGKPVFRDETIEEFIAKWEDLQAKIGSDLRAVSHYETTDIPSDRSFREAWTAASGRVDVDMPKARDIHRNRMRVARAPRLESLDVAYQRADEASDVPARARVASEKQKLRDVTADEAIEAASTPEELKGVWPSVLGDR